MFGIRRGGYFVQSVLDASETLGVGLAGGDNLKSLFFFLLAGTVFSGGDDWKAFAKGVMDRIFSPPKFLLFAI